MSDQDSGMVIALAGVAVGWFLSEASVFIKSRRKTAAVRRALLAELQDMFQWAGDVEAAVVSMARKITKGSQPTDILVKIAHPIFSEHFPQICLELTTAERLSFIAIHRYVDALHAQYERLAEARSEYGTQWGHPELTQLLRDIYVNARFVSYRISWHLERARRPHELFLHAKTQVLIEQFQGGFQKALREGNGDR